MPSILDELTWIPPAMGFRGAAPASSMSIAFSTRDSQRNLRVGSPWFIRSLLPEQFGKHWSESCGLLRRKEIPIFCSADMLQKVPAKDLPVRFAVRNNSQPLRVLDLKTADILELDCRDSQDCHWSWPLEVGTLARLPSFVGAVRQAAGGTTPIGLSLPVGVHKADLASCIQAQVDFLTLIDDGDSQLGGDGLLIESLASTRALLIKAGQPQLPVLVVTSPQSIEHALKLLAIGATAISLDSLLHNAMTGATIPMQILPIGCWAVLGPASRPRQSCMSPNVFWMNWQDV